MVALKQLHFMLCILLAFADTADKNSQCQRTWEILSRLSVKQAHACYKNKQIQADKCPERFNPDLQMSPTFKIPSSLAAYWCTVIRGWTVFICL